MSFFTSNRSAGAHEIAAEMDRRGAVIIELEAEIERLRKALTLPDAERRLWFITDQIDTLGYVNRADICRAFGISVPQSSLDLSRWMERHPGRASYNTSRKRYERSVQS